MNESPSADKKPNRLIHEKSPYLLQHAYNPVEWFPYSDEAFEKAEKEDRLVLISIGYATCHWCHVMERESFEDPETARLLNERFVAVKVDREERPDVDQIYMRALQATGQHGGWPLNMFLTPDRRPIAGGTYFPPVPMHGRPSFQQVLASVHEAWKSNRSKILESAETLTSHLQSEEKADGKIPPITVLANAAAQYGRVFDAIRGGFLTNGVNKFPPSLGLLLLLAHHEDSKDSKDSKSLEMVEGTLDAMKRGGIYDQIGGGLCRYSTDHDWLVPHFEKMLYDNAQFTWALVETFRVTGKDQYKSWALDVIDYVFRDLSSPSGAFYCAEDADSEGEEGLFYVWKSTEIEEVLAKGGIADADLRRLLRFWGISARGNFEGKNILHEPLPRREFLRASELESETWDPLVSKARAVLLEARSKRVRPLRDDKVLVSWNALMITALTRAAVVFDRPDLAERARNAALFIWKEMRTADGRLLRRYREGEARHPATLPDHALLACAFLDLYRAEYDPIWLDRASELARLIRTRFPAEGGFYDTADDVKDVILRTRDAYDGVEPSGNSGALRLFLTLAGYGIDAAENRKAAESILSQFGGAMENYGMAHPAMIQALPLYHKAPVEFVITAADEKDAEFQKILQWLDRTLGPDRLTAAFPPRAGGTADGALKMPLFEGRLPATRVTAYYCTGFACKAPVFNLEDLRKTSSS